MQQLDSVVTKEEEPPPYTTGYPAAHPNLQHYNNPNYPGYSQPQSDGSAAPQPYPYSNPSYGIPPPQQQVIMVNQSQPGVIFQLEESYSRHIAYACLVAWCFNPLFGLIAFMLAMVASSESISNPTGARKLGRASIAISSIGIVVAVIIVIIYFSLITTSQTPSNCAYYHKGIC